MYRKRALHMYVCVCILDWRVTVVKWRETISDCSAVWAQITEWRQKICRRCRRQTTSLSHTAPARQSIHSDTYSKLSLCAFLCSTENHCQALNVAVTAITGSSYKNKNVISCCPVIVNSTKCHLLHILTTFVVAFKTIHHRVCLYFFIHFSTRLIQLVSFTNVCLLFILV